MEIEKQVREAYAHGYKWLGSGETAGYIPQLKKMDSNLLSLCVVTTDNQCFDTGDAEARFTIQSISKVITLATALQDKGFDHVFSHVGMEPTGDSFNSIVRLEGENAKPLNPLINAGAIAVTSCVAGENGEEKFQRILAETRSLLGNDAITFHEEVYRSEKATGDKNRALAYMLQANDVFQVNVEEILDVYFKVCAIQVSCKEIAKFGSILANQGVCPVTGKQRLDPKIVKSVVSLMSTCGMYDASGEYALKVGIPSKSGVGGGILSCVPGKMGIGAFSPSLDKKGNSLCGIKMLEHLAGALNLSIF